MSEPVERHLRLVVDVPSPEAIALLTGQRWVASPVLMEMGAEWEFDYARDGRSFKDRLTHCYELAAKAFFDWHEAMPTPEGLPEPMSLVHGTWSSPDTRDAPIPHAWVLLDDYRIWEPISEALFNAEKFYEYTQGKVDWIYHGEALVHRNVNRSGHYGPWHGEG